jgi:hypothetical protein
VPALSPLVVLVDLRLDSVRDDVSGLIRVDRQQRDELIAAKARDDVRVAK